MKNSISTPLFMLRAYDIESLAPQAPSGFKIEKLGDTYYRFCDIDDPDLALILDSFGISIPKKCFKIGEIRQLKAKMKMSM